METSIQNKILEESLAEKLYDLDGVIYGGWAIPWNKVGKLRHQSYISRARLAIEYIEQYNKNLTVTS